MRPNAGGARYSTKAEDASVLRGVNTLHRSQKNPSLLTIPNTNVE